MYMIKAEMEISNYITYGFCNFQLIDSEENLRALKYMQDLVKDKTLTLSLPMNESVCE